MTIRELIRHLLKEGNLDIPVYILPNAYDMRLVESYCCSADYHPRAGESLIDSDSLNGLDISEPENIYIIHWT